MEIKEKKLVVPSQHLKFDMSTDDCYSCWNEEWPFGTSINAEAAFFANEFDRRRMFLAFIIPGKRMAIAICPERW
jgi:hypothetical protein